MDLTLRLAALFCMASALGCAGTWSGVLVDAKCYASEESNVNPRDTTFWVDTDRNSEIRYCHPKSHTTSFAIVQQSGESLKLDSASDVKASEIARNGDKKYNLYVDVTGEQTKGVVKVDSISVLH